MTASNITNHEHSDVTKLKGTLLKAIAEVEDIRLISSRVDEENNHIELSISGKDLVSNGDNIPDLRGECYGISTALFNLISEAGVLKDTNYRMQVKQRYFSSSSAHNLIEQHPIDRLYEANGEKLSQYRSVHSFLAFYHISGDKEKTVMIDASFKNLTCTDSFFLGTKTELSDRIYNLLAKERLDLQQTDKDSKYLRMTGIMLKYKYSKYLRMTGIMVTYKSAEQELFRKKNNREVTTEEVNRDKQLKIRGEKLKQFMDGNFQEEDLSPIVDLILELVYSEYWDTVEINSLLSEEQMQSLLEKSTSDSEEKDTVERKPLLTESMLANSYIREQLQSKKDRNPAG